MRLVAALLMLALLMVFSVVIFRQPGLTVLVSVSVTAALAVLFVIAAFVRYKRPKADQAMVRTGGKKYKVKFEGGGILYTTVFHEVRPVSLNTMRLEISRQGPEESLITSDFMRADVQAVFYVRVKPDEENVIKAAQTLGERTVPVQELRRALSIGRRQQPPPRPGGGKEAQQRDLMIENIKALLDDKVDGALRAVAATMMLEELQKERQKFAEQVREVCQGDLMENGLALETVTITMLNQTPVAEMDPENRFDAIGIKEVTDITKRAFKEKEQIIKDTDVAVTKIEVNAAKEKFNLQKDKSWAESDMQMQIATYAATKEAETIKISYEQELIGTKAGILKDQELQRAEIDKMREVEIAKVEQEQKVAERGIEKNLIVETKTIEQGQKVAEREIQMTLEVGLKRIDQEREIQTKDYDKILAIEKAKLTQEEGVAVRDVEKILAISMAKIQQEQTVMEREIEKNKYVEVASIEMGQKIQEREIERNLIVQQVTFDAQVGIKEAEVDSLKKQYVLEKDRALTDADQKKIIQAYSATRKAEGTKIQFEQEAVERKAMIAKDQAIMEREIEKNRYVEVASIEQSQKVQEREIERNLVIQQVTFDAQVGIKEAEVGSLKKQYVLEKDRVVTDADQKKIIQAYSATRKAEGTKVQFEQEAIEKQAVIAKDQAIMEREIEKNKYVETAQIDMGQTVQVREIERNLQVQKATFEAHVGIKRADVDSQIKQFGLEQDRSWAEADQRKRITAYVAERQAEAAQIIYEQNVVKETARISREQRVMEREIERNLVVETAQIAMGKQVRQAEINQQLVVGLADEDRKIEMEQKMKQTDLATKEHLEATAVKNVADVHAITVQRVGEADRDKEVAIINAEREAKPMERLADAILAQAKAKAEGQKKAIEAKNVAEQRILVQEAILSLIQTSPQLVERLMKPVEKIESIRILDMGGQGPGGGGGLDKSAMGKIATNLMDTGSVMPMVKEFLKFADVDADDLARKASEYLSGLIKVQPKK